MQNGNTFFHATQHSFSLIAIKTQISAETDPDTVFQKVVECLQALS